MNNLKTVLGQLKSEKIKERQEGLSALRTVFARDSAVSSLDESGYGRAWLVVFQALFTAVLNEKASFTKPSKSKAKPGTTSTAAAARRLADAASTVRWLTDRAISYLNRKAVKSVIAHLLHTIVHNGYILAPVTLDYIKALRCVIGHEPHLDHLDDESWLTMVGMAFNIVLGDPIRKVLGDEEEEGEGSLEEGAEYGDEARDDDDEFFEEDEEENMPSTSTSVPSRKRKLHEPSATPRPTVTPTPKLSKHKAVPTVSLEQIEFISLLATLLSSSSAPLLSPSYTYLPSAILSRLSRFLTMNASGTSSSLHPPFLHALSSTLSHLALNKRNDVTVFAQRSWGGLVGLWGTKNRSMKESLVCVFRILFPFFTSSHSSYISSSANFSWADGVYQLWQRLDGEVESRWGVDGLDFEKLRLEVCIDDAAGGRSAFNTGIFRAGWGFDAGQALAWSILELQADCAEKLFLFSESTHSSNPMYAQRKRAKLENPINTLLSSISAPLSTPTVRCYNLQTLLFFISRHWSILHAALQTDIFVTLMQLVTVDDGSVQSWVFMCFSAIAYADNMATDPQTTIRDAKTWDPVWTHAIRRVNVPSVSRAASHAACILLLPSFSHSDSTSWKVILTSSRVLLEIETLAKDLDVQGPPAPSDAVCAFLATCLSTAAQDVRLYRMQLEEKVLSWLMDTWGRHDSRARGRMPPYMVSDMVTLLECICAFTKRSNFADEILLPSCVIVKNTVEEQKTRVIRDFLLDAKLPPFRPLVNKRKNPIVVTPEGSSLAPGSVTVTSTTDLAQPRGRERRVSVFLLKTLDALLGDWEGVKEHAASQPSVESARQALDLAITALLFEALLVHNGIYSNRRVVQGACKLVTLVIPLIVNAQWTAEERALVLLGLLPLISAGDQTEEVDGWEAMLPPDHGTGIRSETLMALANDRVRKQAQATSVRRDVQRVIWQSADVQDAFSVVMITLRNMLRIVVGETSTDPQATHTVAADDKYDFGPIRTNDLIQSLDTQQQQGVDASNCCIANVCILFLAVVPVLQSTSGEATRDRELTELVSTCVGEKFLLVAPIYLDKVRDKTLNLNVATLETLLYKVEALFKQYTYARNERMQLLVTQFLDATMHLWLKDSVAATDIGGHSRVLCRWLSLALRKGKVRSWRVRDCAARFLGRYLTHDPYQKVWSITPEDEEDEGVEALPVAVLNKFGADEDIRIRFLAAVANARLFAIARTVGQDPMVLYEDIKRWLTVVLDNYEHMLTRLLSLGNVMVVSSAVRRGPYWHLLETCLRDSGTIYTEHIESILKSVSERMGLERFSDLFEAYASQIAYSIRQGLLDFLRFQPRLLGYRDRKQFADATFCAFTPTNILAGGPQETAVEHSLKLFANHCKATQKTTADGIRECFGDIVGFQIVFWIDEHLDNADASFDHLDGLLRTRTMDMGEQGHFEELLELNVDTIVSAILRTLGDQDFSQDGVILQTLKAFGDSEGAVSAFRSMTRYRNMMEFEVHAPNLPCFSTVTILRALRWFDSRVAKTNSRAITYHVLHQLFADIQHSSLVNEQIRVINAVSLWVSLHSSEFEDPTLLHTLIRGATSLLAQCDLARAAQSILDWSFRLYDCGHEKGSHLPDFLIRICSHAYSYAKNAQDTSISKMGYDILQWVDKKARYLCANNQLRTQVMVALPAWPHPPSLELTRIYEDLSSQTLSSILNSDQISSNKFRLVRGLCDLAKKSAYDSKLYATTDFWRLKECIPPVDQLQDSDIDAFADLLMLQQGQIDSFRSEPQSSRLLRSRYRDLSIRSRESFDRPPQQSIVLSLLTTLQGGTAAQVHAAYYTLRLLMSINSSDIPAFHAWPLEHTQELEYLEKFPRLPKTRPVRDMNELATSVPLDKTRQFPEWIAMITTLLSDILAAAEPFYAQLTTILQSDVEFAEENLPVLVRMVLQADLPSHNRDGVRYRTQLSNYFTSILKSEIASISCLRSIIDTVLHLRNFRPEGSRDFLAHDKWLDVDFTLLARSAITCGAYTTALLFLELSAEYRTDAEPDHTATEHVLYDIYSHIDEPDGFYGIKSTDPRQFLIKRFHHEKKWEKAFRFHGAALEAGSTDSMEAEGLLHSFHSFGFDHLAINTLQSSSTSLGFGGSSSSMSYQLGWRTETWDLPDQTGGRASGASLYSALRAIFRERNPQAINSIVRRALREEIGHLRELGSENIAGIRDATQNLMCLTQVAQWRDTQNEVNLRAKQVQADEWDNFVQIDPGFGFSDLENIMATRISLVRSIRQREEREQIGTLTSPVARKLIDIEKRCLVRLSEAARDSSHIQVALNSIIRAQKLEQAASFEVSQEFASVLWIQKEEKLAVQLLKDLIAANKEAAPSDEATRTRRALLFSRLGTWTSEACLEKPTEIVAKYFDPATSIISSIDFKDPAHATVYHQCAMFAEHQYQAILRSPDAIRWKVYVDRKTEETNYREERMRRLPTNSREYQELKSDQRKAQQILDQDKKLARQHDGTRDAFLEQAIDMYSRCLEAADSFDDDGAIRLCSLWFANFDDNKLQNKVRVALDRVPSRKFVFLAHQLSARLSKSSTAKPTKNQENLTTLIVRMCRDHPFHSLYQVYCLRPDRSPPVPSQSRRQSVRHESSSSQTERAAAASDIFERLRGDRDSGSRLCDIEKVCNASLQWAQFPIRNNPSFSKHRGLLIPSHLPIRSVRNVKVPVVTAHTPLDPTLRYDDCAWIGHFDVNFETAGGINLPKICICHSSDGRKFKQLYKGEGQDDLRQDAVMEQVFDLVNTVLCHDRETRRRKLCIRDYKVIPLAARAGVLEFVVNTTPLLSWLQTAHVKYRPNDLKNSEIRPQLIGDSRPYEGRPEPHVTTFLDIRKRFQPVMRHFFTEKHKTPISWFAMRLEYTRSVATTSIIGHMLGLGDRHPSNILIDNGSGEVVHIDLGIAFEQGRLLKTPELVPFRLTADMIDGMGVSGTQGVFQRCAEETLRVLREGSEVIMTVLEVFKHDPLYSWTASDLKIRQLQGTNESNQTVHDTTRLGIGINMSSGTADEAADRALSSVARKLDKALSVEYTVNELIAEATDITKLATMFGGWSPHL